MCHWEPYASLTGSGRAERLREEIAVLERRLEDMGQDGDCAYERAISRLYTGMLADKRLLLAGLRQSLQG